MPTNYEPSDDVRVFDGGEDDEDVEGSRLPLLIVIALLVLAAFGGVVWLAYQRGVQQGHAEVPRVIAADQGPVKVPPASAGGTPTPYTGLKIYQQPAPSNEDADSNAASPQPTAAPATKPAPVAATPAPPPSAPAATPPLKVMSEPAVTPSQTKPAPVKAAAAEQPLAPYQIEAPEPLPAKSGPVAPARTAPVASAPPARAAPVATTPVSAAPPVTAPVATAPPSGGGLLQIGSYKSEADANTAWTAYRAKHASLLAGTSPNVMQVDLGAKGTWYRLRIVAGDKSAAASLCEKLKAEGAVCIPTK
ncbi:MAG: SPOR domain-containing protein [Rhizomicrobium sp.]